MPKGRYIRAIVRLCSPRSGTLSVAALPPILLHEGAGALVMALVTVLILMWWRQLRHGPGSHPDSLMDLNLEAVATLDLEGRVGRANDAFFELLGTTPDEVVGKPLVTYISAWSRKRFLGGIRSAIGGERVRCEIGLAGRDGSTEAEATFGAHENRDAVLGVWVSIRDITSQKKTERELEDRALHDYLTGLPNRALFHDRLQHAVQRTRRGGGDVALLYVDLDKFKPVNDRSGHAVGDEVLRQVAKRLIRLARAGDTVGRIGGDEFAVLLDEVEDADEAMRVAGRIVCNLQIPIDADGSEVRVSASVGVAISAKDARDVDELLRRADIAMYEGKRRGGMQRHLYTPELEKQPLHLGKRLEDELPAAIRNDELYLEYQPIVDIDGNRIVGVEALVRWEHPELGPIFPAVFIPIAERSSLIAKVDRWVLARSCKEIQLLKTRGLLDPSVRLSVNLSAKHFDEPDLVPALSDILLRAGVDPEFLQLEITETAAGGDRERVQQLKALGVRIAIDDFGTGYSSLAYVKDLDVDVLKVDRSFVHSLGADPASVAIVRTILTLADMLEVEVIIEGVENPDQLVHLKELGSRYVQGFMFGRPVPIAKIPAVFARGATHRHEHSNDTGNADEAPLVIPTPTNQHPGRSPLDGGTAVAEPALSLDSDRTP